MLVEVGGVDDEPGFVAGPGVAVVPSPDPVAGRRLGDAAGPLRDGALGVARPLPPEGGEVVAEPRDLVGADLRGGGKRDGAPEDEGASRTGAVTADRRVDVFMVMAVDLRTSS